MKLQKQQLATAVGGLSATFALAFVGAAWGQPLPGGSLDPESIPKYVTPLVIPPVMKDREGDNSTHRYDIAVRQFQQQILPGGIWKLGCKEAGYSDADCQFPATTVWSYGPDRDPKPNSQGLGGDQGIAPAPNSQFNYPAYTIEALTNTQVRVDWMNQLVKDPWRCNHRKPNKTRPQCEYIEHIVPVDRSLHWANPEGLMCKDGDKVKDCRPDPSLGSILQEPYDGPVPIVTHVHGAHVEPDSDGYPEAWWLPNASDIPGGYSTVGTLVNQYQRTTNSRAGVGSFKYKNDQPSTTLWYHDHTLGMTRNNVYAGPAGFWLIRDTMNPGGETGLIAGTLPGPAPVAGEDLAETNITGRGKYREIPIVIQDRSFNADGGLFYPDNRAFFEGIEPEDLQIPLIGDEDETDIAPIWNPEAFFNVMVVNGVSWPTHGVEPDLYRFRLLNGSNSRFLNLAMFVVNPDETLGAEVPFYQIGAEQSLLPKVVKVATGCKVALPGDGTEPSGCPTGSADPAGDPVEALLMGPAERADVLVDFSALTGKVVRIINTGPDEPFGGFACDPIDGCPPISDPGTTGQVMQFVVGTDTGAGEGATPPKDLVLSLPEADDPAATGVLTNATPRDLALLEEVSEFICAQYKPDGTIVWTPEYEPDGEICVDANGDPVDEVTAIPFGPKAAVLGTNGSMGGTVQLWSDPIQQDVASGATEQWELWNWSADAHPIHLHLVKFKVVNRAEITGVNMTGTPRLPELTEAGWKDTVIAYPGEVTRVNATFDIDGLYVWHCHIVEHEDNEMMVPYCVGDGPGCSVVP